MLVTVDGDIPLAPEDEALLTAENATAHMLAHVVISNAGGRTLCWLAMPEEARREALLLLHNRALKGARKLRTAGDTRPVSSDELKRFTEAPAALVDLWRCAERISKRLRDVGDRDARFIGGGAD